MHFLKRHIEVISLGLSPLGIKVTCTVEIDAYHLEHFFFRCKECRFFGKKVKAITVRIFLFHLLAAMAWRVAAVMTSLNTLQISIRR